MTSSFSHEENGTVLRLLPSAHDLLEFLRGLPGETPARAPAIAAVVTLSRSFVAASESDETTMRRLSELRSKHGALVAAARAASHRNASEVTVPDVETGPYAPVPPGSIALPAQFAELESLQPSLEGWNRHRFASLLAKMKEQFGTHAALFDARARRLAATEEAVRITEETVNSVRTEHRPGNRASGAP